jgi:hypothetical protein
MMNFSMNYRKRAPMGIIQVAQVMDNPRLTPLQVARVPVVKSVVKDVESHISKPIKKDESNEVREIKEKSEKKRIIYTIGEEEEKDEKEIKEIKEDKEHENIPVPVLEEPVIETLSSVVVPVCSLSPIIEEQSKEDDEPQDSIEQVQQIHEIKKKKRRMKGVRK